MAHAGSARTSFGKRLERNVRFTEGVPLDKKMLFFLQSLSPFLSSRSSRRRLVEGIKVKNIE
jgi:hypothetical protein